MEKILKVVGNSLGIIFDREDRNIHNMKEGDIVNITINSVKPNPNKR